MKMTVFTFVLFLIPSLYQNAHAAAHEAMPDCNKMSPSFSISYLDENTDGSISLQEYLQGDPSNEKKMFEHMDANHDGLLDQAEQKEVEQVYQLIHQKAAAGSRKI
ncbi:EF-hand domain-containing protein [Methylophilus medardicus]|uniref:EF-hand domain-containing protein n=1 Tax=Methylophilus medardicus TaxID=2588534 RepID=A0A5B8CRR8_9PROT|nr:hypothetical protein [Methylophilus medardicus]QDC43937.1 hypothetical protein FIU01_04975 [Methylophilus medardicus]QDC48944.1 hypothetical protein FIU00_04975 [Methylophilus medardicus]QDC52649.1 hypothetical protein FIT99_04975 [Methylophilus medardicus]